jgi:phosphatidylglycerol:prolipoprotein diacylglycerol transferase
MGLYPPDDPFLFQTVVFGIPIVVRWYGVFIMLGAVLGTTLAAWRAQHRGYIPEHSWNQLMLGLVMGIAGARIYYVLFEWSRFNGNIWAMINITTGGLAIHGAVVGAIFSAILYTWYHSLPFWAWLDIHFPGFLLAQAIGRWGNFFNQEAHGTPTDLPVGVIIDQARRPAEYMHLPPDTLFHATFLYESLWNVVGVGLLLLVDRWYGTHNPTRKGWLCHGDILFLYAIYYSLGRFWIEGFRTDSLYLGPLRVAQVVSLLLIVVGGVALAINHARNTK